MNWTRQFAILREGYRQYAAFKKFAELSPDQKARSEIPSGLTFTLMKLGPTFIKLGQILSTRPDFLPKEYIQSLEVLQENVPPFSFKEVKTIFEEEFGRGISELYGSFDERPVASASLAQVHFAVLPTGEEVAVKVQRPDIRKKIQDDLDALESLLNFAARVAPDRLKRSNLKAAFDEFKRYTLQELDFVLEDVIVPRVYWPYSSHRILTMQRVSGMRVGQAVSVLPIGQREKIAKRLMEVEMKMFISDGFFHADLHPGNILFRADGEIVLLDFGIFGELSGEEIDHFTLYWLAVVQRQVKRAFYHFTQMTSRLPQADEKAFFEKFNSLAERFYRAKLSELTLTQVYFKMISAGYKHGFIFPSHLMLHAKAITTAEALAFTLDPEIKAEELTKEAVRKEFAKRAGDMRKLSFRISQILPELILTGEVLPGSARDTYDASADLDFAVMGFLDLISSIANRMTSAGNSSSLTWMLIGPFARNILLEYHGEKEVETILEEARRRYKEVEPEIPILSQIGPTINLCLAGATLAMYEALLSAGHSSDEALSIFRQLSWSVYDKMGDLPMMIAGALTSDPHNRMKLATQIFRAFPFSSPDYQMVDLPSGKNVVSFHVLKCPVAEFFKSKGKGDLCYEIWCKLDFPLAEKWGGELERSTTIAQGADRCSFRWKTLPKAYAHDGGGEERESHVSLEGTITANQRKALTHWSERSDGQ